MRHLKILGIALGAMFALGITATSAFALPDISLLPGESFPLHLNFADNGETVSSLETTGGAKLESKSGLLLLLLVEELGSLGTFDALFLKVKEGNTECHTTGDSAGTVLLTGTFHVVLGPPAGALRVLFLVEEFEIVCGEVKVKVKGSVLSTLEAGKESEDLTQASGELKGKNGKPTLTEYYNDNGETVKAKLEANFGSGFQEADENVGEKVTLKALEGKMFVITGR